MRILVTGASGLLGGRLSLLLRPRYDVVGLVRAGKAPDGVHALRGDLAARGDADRLLAESRPDLVIHCAALADAEACEREPERATRENEHATRELALACAKGGARLIAISTDLVFGGDGQHVDEETVPAPLSVYGHSKLAAERAALEACPQALIFRVALVSGRGRAQRATSTEAIAWKLASGATLSLYMDEWRSPIDPESVLSAIEGAIANPDAAGVYHLGGPERITRFDLGRRVAQLTGLAADGILGASRTGHRGAPRARDVSLDSSRARRDLGYAPRPLDVAILEGRTRPD